MDPDQMEDFMRSSVGIDPFEQAVCEAYLRTGSAEKTAADILVSWEVELYATGVLRIVRRNGLAVNPSGRPSLVAQFGEDIRLMKQEGDFTMQEIAQRLGISQNTVFRALKST